MKTPRVFHGDCLEIMPTLRAGSVDLILCDLPYGTTTCRWDVMIPFEPLWKEYWRLLKPQGVIALFGSEPFSTLLRASQLQYFRYDWIWDKKIPSGMGFAKYQPMRQHEVISVFYQKPGRYFPQMTPRKKPIMSGGQKKLSIFAPENGGRLSGSADFKRTYDTKNPTSILTFDKIRKGSVHTTQKPVPLLQYLIETYTRPGDTVLDGCMGSGSTGVAALLSGRRFIGIEKDPKCFEIARKRLFALSEGKGAA